MPSLKSSELEFVQDAAPLSPLSPPAQKPGVLDTRGLAPPVVILRISAAIRSAPAASELTVLTTSELSIVHIVLPTVQYVGCELVSTQERDGYVTHIIRKR